VRVHRAHAKKEVVVVRGRKEPLHSRRRTAVLEMSDANKKNAWSSVVFCTEVFYRRGPSVGEKGNTGEWRRLAKKRSQEI